MLDADCIKIAAYSLAHSTIVTKSPYSASSTSSSEEACATTASRSDRRIEAINQFLDEFVRHMCLLIECMTAV